MEITRRGSIIFSTVAIIVRVISREYLIMLHANTIGSHQPAHSAYHVCCIRNSYNTMGCPPVRGDNPRALASGLSYVQVDKHGITILYHLHQCRPCTSQDISS